MNNRDKITLLKIDIVFVCSFIIFPYFVLVRKLLVYSWVPNVFLIAILFLNFCIGRLDKKNARELLFYNILDIAQMCIIFPIFVWSVAAVLLNN